MIMFLSTSSSAKKGKTADLMKQASLLSKSAEDV